MPSDPNMPPEPPSEQAEQPPAEQPPALMPAYPPGMQPWPGYAAPPYGPYWQPPLPPPRRSYQRSTIIAGVISSAVALLLIVSCVVSGVLIQNGNNITARARATLTAAAPTTEAPTPTVPSFYQYPFTSDTDGWTDNEGIGCSLESDGYHVHGIACEAPLNAVADMDMTVEVKQVARPITDGYGIMLREYNYNMDYAVEITSDGEWGIFRCDGDVRAPCLTLVPFTPTTAIHKGLNTINKLEVHAQGSLFQLIINGKRVGSANDTTYPMGCVGVAANVGVEAVFTNVTIELLD